jgi:hypothetical protein
MSTSAPQEPGVPLEHYREHGADIEVSCCQCARRRVFGLERVIAGLEQRGLGGAQTGIKAAGRMLRSPCGHCGATNWDARPKMPAPANPGIPDATKSRPR